MPSRRIRIQLAPLILATLCLLSAGTNAAEYTTIWDNGPSSNRVNMAFLGDGYTASQIETVYPTHINSMLNYMFSGSQDPFPRYENFFNAYRVNVVSKQSGADIPPLGVFRDTALNGTYFADGVTDRLLEIDDSKTAQYYTKLLIDGIVPAVRMVTVNSSRYGGSGGSAAVYAGGNPSATDVALHELGHSFADLADEYSDLPGVYAGPEPSNVNVTKDPTGQKWEQWLGYDQPGIGVIGAYEGGGRYASGLYRPSPDSKMRSLGQPFDAVSREQIILTIYDWVDPLDGWLDNGTTADGTLPLWVDPIDTDVIKLEWYVDGLLVPGATDTSFSLTDYGFGRGTYEVRAHAYDDTDWVRIDLDKLQQDVLWQVTVVPEPASLTLLFVAALGALCIFRPRTSRI